jgi:transposase
VDRNGFVLAFAAAAGNRHDLPPAREALARLRVPAGARPGVFAGDGAFDDRGFRADLEALGFRPDIARNPRGGPRPEAPRPSVPGRRWVVERAHAHLRAFRGIRTRWGRLLGSFEAFLAIAAAHRIIARAGL